LVLVDLTELITFNVLKPERADGLATIMRQAELHELRVDCVEERPRRLSVDIHMTVTGDADSLASFCTATGGRVALGPPQRVRQWLGGIIDGALTYWP
jgi:hypothetical protein